MSGGLVIALALGGAAIAWVVAPLFRKDAAEAENVARRLGESADLASRREMTLAALKDLEDDRATGKIGESDYEQLHAKLTARAVEIMKRLDELEAERGGAVLSGPKVVPRREGESAT